MPALSDPHNTTRIAWVTHTFTSGGIGPVCRYAAQAAVEHLGWRSSVVSLHDAAGPWMREENGICLASLKMPPDSPQEFLRWLQANPQDVLITNDVSTIEACFPYFPEHLLHVIQLHDSGAPYRRVAIRHARWVDGVAVVADYIKDMIARELERVSFNGIVVTIHNGANFPPAPVRKLQPGPLRLLFMGRLDPLVKGIFDLVPILRGVRKAGIPFAFQIVGGSHDGLKSRLDAVGVGNVCQWLGRVPHEECFKIAAECDILLLPSRREPFGMVTIEAMAMGCVPMAYDIPSGSREIIENGRSGRLIKLGDFRAWAGHIEHLNRNREELHKMSNAAMGRARGHFSGEALAQRLGNLVATLQGNALQHRPARLAGLPAVQGRTGHQTAYHKLSPALRAWLRRSVGRYPRLSYWLLQH